MGGLRTLRLPADGAAGCRDRGDRPDSPPDCDVASLLARETIHGGKLCEERTLAGVVHGVGVMGAIDDTDCLNSFVCWVCMVEHGLAKGCEDDGLVVVWLRRIFRNMAALLPGDGREIVGAV